MNSVFSVLWFDDDERFFESIDMDDIREFVGSHGFDLQVKYVSDFTELVKYQPYKSFDLMVIDYHLGDSIGSEVIADIRSNQVYTEVLLYSTREVSKLWESILEHKIEGVFIAPKAVISDKVKKLFELSVRKFLDLNNLRGIVMSEVAALDSKIIEILTLMFNEMTEADRQYVHGRFIKSLRVQIEESNKGIDEISHDNLQSMIDACDSKKLSTKLQRFFNKSKSGLTFDVQHYGEVLNIRNHLAHGKETRSEDGSKFIFKHAGKNLEVDDAKAIEIRNDLRKFKVEFDKIITKLSDKSST